MAVAWVGDVIVVVVKLEAFISDDSVDGTDGRDVRFAANVLVQQPATRHTSQPHLDSIRKKYKMH